ncbi:LuxS/MPP-like metallohydrolase [Fomitopsis serialis]|uniref:LuxS/MPP-like metallohydrolase n=1 Tax=Fomitopsis serialis TaxID=139415 RepID=UPI002007F417|nr:LuxS/MPP-like metallohydrolase [Neoantrodia serialis]KAH9923669.1 LuxS/MPP-like metallohydrolase [Neoantrodia serialis]
MRRATSSLLRSSLRRQRRAYSVVSTDANPPVKITALPNKIRVATESTPGHFSAVGLYVDAGSRYETPSTSGVSHFLDRMAFKTTSSRSDEEMAQAIDKLGGQILCSSSRESIMYQSSHFHAATPLAMSLIADTALQSSFLPEEIVAQREAARYEIREVSAKPEMILPEILHEVAYDGKTLGNPLLCPEHRIDLIDQPTLNGFMKQWYRPERMVIAGAGMPHEELVELADKYFSSLTASPSPSTSSSRSSAQQVPSQLLHSSSTPTPFKSLTRAASSYLYPTSGVDAALSPESSAATYTGGSHFIHNPSSEFNHVYLAFEGVGIHDDDVYTLATMQVLLGGGGSFSAGGPGKGMYSRLYTHILNHYPQIDHCASFHHIYTDSSLFGLFASFVPAAGRHSAGNTPSQIFPHLVHQLSLLLYTPISETELQRAKNQLQSSLMMALESRAVEVEDLGRQVLVHNRKVPVSEMCAKIDAVSAKSLRRVAQRIFSPEQAKRATVVTMGREDLPDRDATLRKYGVGGAV